MGGAGQPLQFGGDGHAGLASLRDECDEVGIAVAIAGPHVGFAPLEVGVGCPELCDHGGLDRFGDGASIEPPATQIVDLLGAAAKLGCLCAGIGEQRVGFAKLLIAEQLLVRADKIVRRLVGLDAVFRGLELGPEVAEVRRQGFRSPGRGSSAGLHLIAHIGFGDGVRDFGCQLGGIGREDDIDDEFAVGPFHREMSAKRLQGPIDGGVRRLGFGRTPQKLHQRAEDIGFGGAVIGRVLQAEILDGPDQNRIRADHTDLALDLNDAAIRRETIGIDVVRDDLAPTRIDQELGGGRVLRFGSKAVKRRPDDAYRENGCYPPAARPQSPPEIADFTNGCIAVMVYDVHWGCTHKSLDAGSPRRPQPSKISRQAAEVVRPSRKMVNELLNLPQGLARGGIWGAR